MKGFRILLVILIPMTLVMAQSDPGKREDAEADRQKLLRAEDELESMTSQVESMRSESDQQKSDIAALKAQVADAKNDTAQLKADIATLKAAVEKLDASRAEEREVLLKKVSEIVADALKSKPIPSASPPPPVPEKTEPVSTVSAPTATAPAAGNDNGFYYTVKKGDTLHDIVAAYVAQGVKVTVDDVRKANKLSKTALIFSGQKLFIPKKD